MVVSTRGTARDIISTQDVSSHTNRQQQRRKGKTEEKTKKPDKNGEEQQDDSDDDRKPAARDQDQLTGDDDDEDEDEFGDAMQEGEEHIPATQEPYVPPEDLIEECMTEAGNPYELPSAPNSEAVHIVADVVEFLCWKMLSERSSRKEIWASLQVCANIERAGELSSNVIALLPCIFQYFWNLHPCNDVPYGKLYTLFAMAQLLYQACSVFPSKPYSEDDCNKEESGEPKPMATWSARHWEQLAATISEVRDLCLREDVSCVFNFKPDFDPTVLENSDLNTNHGESRYFAGKCDFVLDLCRLHATLSPVRQRLERLCRDSSARDSFTHSELVALRYVEKSSMFRYGTLGPNMSSFPLQRSRLLLQIEK